MMLSLKFSNSKVSELVGLDLIAATKLLFMLQTLEEPRLIWLKIYGQLDETSVSQKEGSNDLTDQ